MKEKTGMLGSGGEVAERIAKGEKPMEKERKLMTEDGRERVRTYPIGEEKNWDPKCWWKVSFRYIVTKKGKLRI